AGDDVQQSDLVGPEQFTHGFDSSPGDHQRSAGRNPPILTTDNPAAEETLDLTHPRTPAASVDDAPFAVQLAVPLVDLGVDVEACDLLVGELAAHLGGDAGHERTSGDLHALGDERAGGDEDLVADDGAVHHGGAHADEDVVADGGSVDDGPVTHRDALAEGEWLAGVDVEDAVVLDVGAPADGDRLVVGAQHRAVEDGGSFGQDHLADEGRVGGDP